MEFYYYSPETFVVLTADQFVGQPRSKIHHSKKLKLLQNDPDTV